MLQDNTTSLPPIMTSHEAAKACRLHHTTLRKAIRDGRLQASRPTGRDLRITASAVEQWFAITSTAPRRATSSRTIAARKSSSWDTVLRAGAEAPLAPSKLPKKRLPKPPSAPPPAPATTPQGAVQIILPLGSDSPSAFPPTEGAADATYTG